jgi:pimeloyl-ACP methyl ester carboxylesterase
MFEGFEEVSLRLGDAVVFARHGGRPRRRRPVRCPALILWPRRDDLEDLYGDPLGLWRPWASDVRGHGIDSGHHMAEEAPDEVATSLASFLRH